VGLCGLVLGWGLDCYDPYFGGGGNMSCGDEVGGSVEVVNGYGCDQNEGRGGHDRGGNGRVEGLR